MPDFTLLRATIEGALGPPLPEGEGLPRIDGREPRAVLGAIAATIERVSPAVAATLDGVEITQTSGRYDFTPADPGAAIETAINAESDIGRLLDLREVGGEIASRVPTHVGPDLYARDAHFPLRLLADALCGGANLRLQSLAIRAANEGRLDELLAVVAARAPALANGLREATSASLRSAEETRRRTDSANVPTTAPATVDLPRASGVRLRGG